MVVVEEGKGDMKPEFVYTRSDAGGAEMSQCRRCAHFILLINTRSWEAKRTAIQGHTESHGDGETAYNTTL
jgi:hypothetical protein